MSLTDLTVFFIAWFFQAFTGFGAGIFIVGILSVIYDPKVVIVSSAVINLFGTLFMSALLMRKVRPNFRILLLLILGSVPGIFIGSEVLFFLNRDTLKLLIGVFIFALGVYDLVVQRGFVSIARMREKALTTFGVGFVGGFFAGLIGMGGPPPVVYLNQILEDIEEFKSTLTLFFTSNILFRLLSYGVQGGMEFFSTDLILAGAISIPPAVVLGVYLSRRVKPTALKTTISLSVCLLGLALIVESRSVL